MNNATRYPWRKFYPGQHLTDPRMMFVGLAARGLLVEIEALCYCAEPPGRLTIQGRAMTAAEIARLRGVDPIDVDESLAELLAAGLLATDDTGCIYSPALLAELDERDGTKRRVAKHRKNTAANVTPHVTPGVSPKSRVEKKESRTESEKNTPPAQANAFAEFWASYPKKIARGAAEKSFRKIGEPSKMLPVLLAAITAQKSTAQWQRDNGQFIPNPATWLNQRRWEDDLAALNTTGTRAGNQPSGRIEATKGKYAHIGTTL